jgi:steroid delta-isomerase-like uncharacterized protein
MATAVEVHRAAHDAFNRRDWEATRAITAPDIVYDDHPRGLTIEGAGDFLAWLQGWAAGMSDARTDQPRYLDAGTHSVCMFQGRGVNDGPMGPANATGRSLDLAFCEIVRVQDGRIAGGDLYYDAMTMFAQLGVVEAPATA